MSGYKTIMMGSEKSSKTKRGSMTSRARTATVNTRKHQKSNQIKSNQLVDLQLMPTFSEDIDRHFSKTGEGRQARSTAALRLCLYACAAACVLSQP